MFEYLKQCLSYLQSRKHNNAVLSKAFKGWKTLYNNKQHLKCYQLIDMIRTFIDENIFPIIRAEPELKDFLYLESELIHMEALINIHDDYSKFFPLISKAILKLQENKVTYNAPWLKYELEALIQKT